MSSQVPYFRALVASWRDADKLIGATCAEIGPELWFAGQDQHGREEALARQLCHTCPVRRQCLRIALESDDQITRFGVWAGYTEKRLRRMRRFMNGLARAPRPVAMLPVPERIARVAA